MKRSAIIFFVLFFSVSYCIAQGVNIREAAQERERREAEDRERLQREEQQRREAERLKREAEERRLFELEQSYQNAITSAENNYTQGEYAKAKQDYMTALGLKPAEANTINAIIAEIDKILLEQEIAERELRYQQIIASAQSNFDLRQLDQAEQGYKAALELKPENAAFILAKIAEIDSIRNAPAILYIYRTRDTSLGGILGVAPRYDVLLDNAVVGRSTSNWKTTVSVDKFGTKTVSANIEGRRAEVRINFQPGGEYYVRSDFSSTTRDTGRTQTTTLFGRTVTTKVTETLHSPTFQIVENSVGESEFNSINK